MPTPNARRFKFILVEKGAVRSYKHIRGRYADVYTDGNDAEDVKERLQADGVKGLRVHRCTLTIEGKPLPERKKK